MSEAEDRLFGLMAVVEDQQAVMQAALEGLAAERALVQGEREAFAKEMVATARRQQAAGQVALDALENELGLLRGARFVLATGVVTAVSVAVDKGLAGAATTAAAAVEEGARPLLEKLGGVVEGAVQAEAALRRVVLWASWRLLGWVMAAAVALILAGWGASTVVVWWDTGTITATRLEKVQLQAEVGELTANRDRLIKNGMLARVQHCNPGNRPCIQVDESAGPFGDERDIRVIKGY